MKYNSFEEEPKISINLNDKKKPYVLLNNVVYLAHTDKYTYRIAIPKGYSFDGATIPRFFYRIIGSKGEIEFLPAALIHDWLCENKSFIEKHGVQISSDIFRDILILYKVPKWKAKTMATAVRMWQTFQPGWK